MVNLFVFFDSTISHIGFLLLALAINTEQSIDSFLFYLIQYTITNLNIFLIILALTYIIYASNQLLPMPIAFAKLPAKGSSSLLPMRGDEQRGEQRENLGNIRDIRYISELKGLFFSNPLLSLSLGICLFSMAGIPPVKNYGKILYWEKLSNSGDTLKLMIPSYSRKAICG
jgi:NADH-ubiquinone oxidoreductase chain 2